MEKLIVIAGGGLYPKLVIDGAKRAGVARVDVLAVKGSTKRATWKAADNVHWITIGQIADGIRWMGSEGYDGAILAGQVNPLSLFRGRFDNEVKGWLAELPVKNAHSIFGKLIEKIEGAGVKVLPASLYMDDYIPSAGALTKRSLSESEASDLKHAIAVGVEVYTRTNVYSGMVVAVEAFEGTNAAIKRGGKLAGRGSLVFKAARQGHDMRFDIPVVGLKTLKTMKKARASALVFQAGRLVLLDREDVVRYADAHGIAIVGIDSGLESAPLRP